MYEREQVRSGKVPLGTKVLQGVGALPGAHKDFAFNTFLLLFYSQVLGLSATLASTALAIGLIVDAVSDPLMGAYSDNFVSRRFPQLGRRHLFMYLSAIPVGVSLYFLFAPPTGLSGWLLFAWLLFFVICSRVSFTLFVVPWSALPAELSDDYAERTSLYVFRYLVGWGGGLLFLVAIYSLVLPSSVDTPGQLVRGNYATFAWVLAGAVTLWILLTTHFTRDQVRFLKQPTKPTPRINVFELFGQLRLALASKNFRLLFVSTLAFSGIAGVGQVFDIFMNTYFWEFSSEQLVKFAYSGFGALVAFISVPALQRRYEKQQILRVAVGLVMLLGMAKVGLRFADIWPENHDPRLLTMLILHLAVVIFLLTTAGIMFGSIMADLVDEQDARTGLRQEGVFASAISFSAKAAPSIGIVVGGFLLDKVIGLADHAMPGAVAGDILFRLALIDGVLINSLFLLPLWWLRRYSLSREDVARLQERARQVSPTDSDTSPREVS